MNNPLRDLPKAKLHQLLLTILLAVAVINAVSYFYVRQQWTTLRLRQEQIAKLRVQIDEADQRATQEAKDEKLHAQIQAFVEEQREGIVTGDPLMWVVREMTLLSEKRPIQMQTPRAGLKGTHPRRSNVPTYTTRLELTGSYDQIGTLVRDLENRYLSAEIQALEIGGTAEGGVVRASVELAFVVDPTPVAAAKPTEKKSP